MVTCLQWPGPPVSSRDLAIESLGDLAGRHQLHPRGGQLQRQGQAVEAVADLDHRLVRFEPGLHLARPRHEELGRRRIRERRNRILLLAGKCEPLPGSWRLRGHSGCRGQDWPHVEPRPRLARSCQGEAEAAWSREEFGHITPRVDDLPISGSTIAGSATAARAPARDRRDSPWSRSRRVRALVASSPRLRPRQREQRVAAQEGHDCGEFCFPAEEGCRLHWQGRLPKGAETPGRSPLRVRHRRSSPSVGDCQGHAARIRRDPASPATPRTPAHWPRRRFEHPGARQGPHTRHQLPVRRCGCPSAHGSARRQAPPGRPRPLREHPTPSAKATKSIASELNSLVRARRPQPDEAAR